MRSMETEALAGNLPGVLKFISENLVDLACTKKEIMQVKIVVEELFINIVNYAYKGAAGKAGITMTTFPDERRVEIILSDEGEPFDPLKEEDPDTTLGWEDRPIGGLGIFMVKENVDDISYEYKDNKNIVRIEKTFS